MLANEQVVLGREQRHGLQDSNLGAPVGLAGNENWRTTREDAALLEVIRDLAGPILAGS